MNLLTTLALALALLIGLLAVPLELQFRFSWGRGLEQNMRLVWAFGLARISLLPGRTKSARDAPRESPAKTPRRSDGTRRTTRRALEVLGDEPLRRRVLRYLGDLWRATEKHEVRLYARIGLDDPADTGQLWALAGPVSAALSSIRDASILLEPDFAESVFELDASGRIRAVPLRLIGLTLMLIMSPGVFRRLVARRA